MSIVHQKFHVIPFFLGDKFTMMKGRRRFSMVSMLISLNSSTISLFSDPNIGKSSSTSSLTRSSSLSSSSIVIWFEVRCIISSYFSLSEGFVITIVCFFPFNITLKLTTHSYYLFMCEGILIWRSFKPFTKFGWWLSTCLSSFDLGYPSLVKINVCFRVISLFWVPILSKIEAQVIVIPRRSQT